jgi:hypothetical protein
VDDSASIRILHELIAALDRRVPRAGRAGEAAIMRDAATLRASALERLAALEDEPTFEPRDRTADELLTS